MMNKPEMKSCITGSWSPVITTSVPNSGSGVLQRDLINERKRKRLESNRESARRSRMKKREHVNDLIAQLTQLRKENRQATAEITVTTECYVKIEAENSAMRAQVTELNQRLTALNQIIAFAETYSSAAAGGFGMETGHSAAGGFETETALTAATGGFGMETDPSAAGGFEMETGHSAAGGFGMKTGQGGGVTDYSGGGSGSGGGGLYEGMLNQPPNMASAFTAVGDVLNHW